jgi:hypothetical protein
MLLLAHYDPTQARLLRPPTTHGSLYRVVSAQGDLLNWHLHRSHGPKLLLLMPLLLYQVQDTIASTCTSADICINAERSPRRGTPDVLRNDVSKREKPVQIISTRGCPVPVT